jgi:hypothetical protein
MSLASMFNSAQGGAFYRNAAATAGVSEADARTAITAMAPAIAARLKTKSADDPDAFEALLDLLEEGGDLDDVEATTGAEALSDGAQILQDLYGAKAASGLDADVRNLSEEARNKLSAISATAVLAALAASQPQAVASADASPAGQGASNGIMAVIWAALVKGLLQALGRQFAPKRRRRRRTGYSYLAGRRPARRRTRKPTLDAVFDAIMKNR